VYGNANGINLFAVYDKGLYPLCRQGIAFGRASGSADYNLITLADITDEKGNVVV